MIAFVGSLPLVLVVVMIVRFSVEGITWANLLRLFIRSSCIAGFVLGAALLVFHGNAFLSADRGVQAALRQTAYTLPAWWVVATCAIALGRANSLGRD